MRDGQTTTLDTIGGKRRGRRPRLTPERIARAALELVDQEGLESLSMQRLAGRLGIGTMTLYGYFRSKDELLQAVVDEAVRPPTGRQPSSRGGWRQQMRAVVNAAHRTLTRHPALVQIRFREPVLRPDALRFGERIVAILREAGFDEAESASAFRLIFTYTFGFAGLSPARDTQKARAQAVQAAAALPSQDFPYLSATAPHWTNAMGGEEHFQYGLDRILDGLQSRLERLPKERR